MNKNELNAKTNIDVETGDGHKASHHRAIDLFVKHSTVNDTLLFAIMSAAIFGITVFVIKSLNQSPILHTLSWPLVLLVFSVYLNSIYLFHNYLKQSRTAELLETMVGVYMKTNHLHKEDTSAADKK